MQPHIFISTPSHDGRVHLGFHISMLKLFDAKPCKVTVSHPKGGGISVARNHSAYEFLQSSCTHLFCMDGDLRFEPGMVQRILGHDLPVCGGIYFHKNLRNPPLISGNAMPGREPDTKTGLLECASLGTGFLCIKREVVKRVWEALPHEHHKGKGEYAGKVLCNMFGMGVVTDPAMGIPEPEHITEDFMFCLHARRLGYKIWADTGFYLPHIGDVDYPVNLSREVAA